MGRHILPQPFIHVINQRALIDDIVLAGITFRTVQDIFVRNRVRSDGRKQLGGCRVDTLHLLSQVSDPGQCLHLW